MGATKTEAFSEKQNRISILMKALGHPARVAIIEHLMSVDTCICGDIVNVLPLAQPTVSQHLRELKSAGLIKGKVDGNAICYCIDRDAIMLVEHYFGHVSANLKMKNNCC